MCTSPQLCFPHRNTLSDLGETSQARTNEGSHVKMKKAIKKMSSGSDYLQIGDTNGEEDDEPTTLNEGRYPDAEVHAADKA
jgi:hypothetical protein